MSVGTIPWTAMIKYTKHYSLDWDVTEAFVDIIREMDQAFRSYHLAEQEKHKPKK